MEAENGSGPYRLVSRLGTLMRQESASYFLIKLAIDADDSWQQSLTRQLYAMELCYECGCKSPLLYLDAAQLYLRQEGQLRRISPFTVQVLKFAQKEGILSGELLKRAAYLTETMKTFDENVYQILTAGYERFPSDEVLEAICKLVMKGRPVRKEYFPWYAKPWSGTSASRACTSTISKRWMRRSTRSFRRSSGCISPTATHWQARRKR